MTTERAEVAGAGVTNGHFGPWTVPGPALTLNQLRELPQGTEVEIVWSGGNGPHRGRIVFDGRGEPFYVPEFEYEKGPEGPLWFYNPIGDFVGEHPRTQVRLVVQKSQG